MRTAEKILAALLVAALPLSCSKKDAGPRIAVYSADGSLLKKTLFIPVEGGNFTLTAETESELDISYSEAVGAVGGWFRIQDISKAGDGKWQVKCSADPLERTLDLRNGTLSFSAPEDYIGAFLNVRQGYERVWSQNFSQEPDGFLTLAPGESWNSGFLTGISSVKDVYLAFEARAESVPGSEFINYPLSVEILGGGFFPEIERDVYVQDVEPAEAFNVGSFHKMRIWNSGKVFSSESTLTLSVPYGSGSAIYIDNVVIYEIPVESGDIGISEEDGDED